MTTDKFGSQITQENTASRGSGGFAAKETTSTLANTAMPALDAAVIRAAQLTTCAHSRDSADARDLLWLLGLLEPAPGPAAAPDVPGDAEQEAIAALLHDHPGARVVSAGDLHDKVGRLVAVPEATIGVWRLDPIEHLASQRLALALSLPQATPDVPGATLFMDLQTPVVLLAVEAA